MNRRLCLLAAAFSVLQASVTQSIAAVAWTGAGGTSWATNSSWSNNAGPSSSDTVTFSDTGSTNIPGDLTSLLNTSRTIAGLSFSNTLSKYHTLDLNGQTLTVAGNLNFNLDQNSTTTTTVRNGTLNVNSAFATIGVGRAVSGSAVSIADLSGTSSFTANVQNIYIGASSAGTASGTLTLGASNSLTASSVIKVGASNGTDANGVLHLGAANSIQTPEFDIGNDYSSSVVDAPNGSSVSIGTSLQRTVLQIANQNTNTNNTYASTLNLGNAAVTLRLDSLVVSQKVGGPGNAVGQLMGGGSGSVAIGDPAARGNIFIGNCISGGNATGTADFSHLSSFTAYVNDAQIGTSPVGSSTGTLLLATNSTFDSANNITVGSSGNGDNKLRTGSGTTTLLANQLNIGQDYSSGTVLVPVNGTLTLGSPGRRISLQLANSVANTNSPYTGKIDATGATLNGYLSSLIVGQRQAGGGGTNLGMITGAVGGSMDIGAPGNTANMIIANNLPGGAPVSGSVDFSGLNSLTASLDKLTIATSVSGSAQGTLALAKANNISVNTIIVGSSGDGTGSLTLGQANTILANQITVAAQNSNGTITLPTNGTLNLGSPSQRTSITVCNTTAITPTFYNGLIDFSAGTINAYLDNVSLGNKNNGAGTEQATLTISNKAANYIDANTLTIAGPNSIGTVNFAGGQLYAGTIAPGGGTPTFNWTGGQLSVGTFGSPSITLNLSNSASGTLAPGSPSNPIGTTQVFGNYAQTSAGTTALQIAGTAPGTGNDLLSISGSATLAGNLNLSLTNGFIPSVGQNLLLATYSSRSGTYAFVAPPSMPQGVAFQLDYTGVATQLQMHMVTPVSQTYTSVAAQGTWSTAGNWNNNTAPGTVNFASITNNGASAQTITVNASTTVHRVALQGNTAPVNLEILQGVKFGVANELRVGTNASLTGGGQVLGAVTVAGGVIAPGPGPATLTLSGNLTELAFSALNIEIGGISAAQHDLLAIGGDIDFAGDLNVSLINGYAPAAGDRIQLLSFASASGQFDHIALPSLASGLIWDTTALTTTGQISVAVPEPAMLGLVSVLLITSPRRERRR